MRQISNTIPWNVHYRLMVAVCVLACLVDTSLRAADGAVKVAPDIDANTKVTVERLDGSVVTGQLVSLETDELTIATGDGPQTIGTSEVLSLAPQQLESPTAVQPRVWLHLTDGSRVRGTTFRESAGTAVVGLLGDDSIDLPTRSIRWVRFNPPSDARNNQWDEIVSRKATVDVVVVRRPGSNLDYVEGALENVADQSVRFSFDGDAVNVPRSRLEGLVYYVSVGDQSPRIVCRAVDIHGNSWNAKSVALSGDHFRLRTGADVSLSMPLDRLEQLDFGIGNVVYLSDLKPLKIQWTPLLASNIVSDGLERLFQPRHDQSFSGQELRLRFTKDANRIQEFHKGLAIHSRTELVYRLPDGFRRLTAWVGIDEGADEGGSAQLTISGDGQLLLHRVVTGQDEPVPIDVDVEGRQRLSILVDFADDEALAGHLDLCNIRITK